MSFSKGDIVIPSVNNIQSAERPMPKYKIYQISMGRVLAENMNTGEIVDLAGDGYGSAEYYYEKLK